MRATLITENLKRSLGIAGYAVSGKAVLPQLSHVRIKAEGGYFTIASTNLELSIVCGIGARIEEEGAYTVPYRLLADTIGAVAGEHVTLELDSNERWITIASAGGKRRDIANIAGGGAAEFPNIPETSPDDVPVLTLPPGMLSFVADAVASVAGSDPERVTGAVHLAVLGNILQFTAADGFRFARVRYELPAAHAPLELLIPSRSVYALAKATADDENGIGIVIPPGEDAQYVLFDTGVIQSASRILAGQYPPIDKAIPETFSASVALDTKAFARAIRTAAYFTTKDNPGIGLAFDEGGIVITSGAGDNTHTNMLIADVTGSAETRYNASYLQSACSSIDTERMQLEIGAGSRIAVFRPVTDDLDYFHAVLPMR